MEETKISNHQNAFTIPILYNNYKDSLPKCLSKSKIKAMQGKIFWTRKSSESSLEKIIKKDKQYSPNKLQQYRQNSLTKQKVLKELVQKLCLPKIRETYSLHQSKVNDFKIDETIESKNKQNNLVFKKNKFSKFKQEIYGKDHKMRQILQIYNRRCKAQIQQFQFNNVLLSFDRNLKGQNEILKVLKSTKDARNEKNSKSNLQKTQQNQCDNTYLPKQMLRSLTKHAR